MKKSFITLLALAGTAAATEYDYIGTSEKQWIETQENWQIKGTETTMGTGHMANNQNLTNNHTFNIANGETAKAGSNTGGFKGATVNVSNKSTLQTSTANGLQQVTKISVTGGSTLDIQSGAQVGNDNTTPRIEITGNSTLKVGGTVTQANVVLTDATVAVNGGSLKVTNAGTVKNTTFNVTDNGTLTFGGDVKMNNVSITTSGTVKVGLEAGDKATYWDNNPNVGRITFNLGDTGKVAYGEIRFKTAEAGQAGWNGSLTLSANCSEGFLEGSELTVKTRDLVTFTDLINNANYGSKEALLADYIKGGSITLNGEALDFSSDAFDSKNLSASDVGKYTFVLTNSAIQLQYVAYNSNQIIPEPATATLSLLALCGLAARRRRK